MKSINLLETPVRRVFLNYLVPSISASLVTSIYILADTMMIGRGIGPIGIAALNIILPIFNVLFGCGMLCGIGGSVLFGFSMGKGKEEEARGYFSMAFYMASLFSVIAVLFCNLFFEPLLTFLGNTESMNDYTVSYGRILVTGAPVYIFSTFLQAFVRNDGAPKLAMAGVVAGGISNVILDYLFIYIMDWGMEGAAAATVMGTVLTILILSIHFFSKNSHLKLTGKFDPAKAVEIAGNGMASFILEVSGGLVMLLFNLQLLKYVGELGVSVYGIISNVTIVVTSLSNGIAQAMQPLVSVNYGAGNTDRIRQAKRLGIGTALAAGLCFTASGFLIPVPIASLFMEPTGEILAMAVPAIKLYFISYFFGDWNIICSTYFQSIVQPKRSLTVTLMRGVVLNCVLVFVLPMILGVNGIWLTVTVSEIVTAAVVVWFMRNE